MTIRQVWLVASISLGVGGALMAPTDATALTCPDAAAANVPGGAPPLGDLYAGANDGTASYRLGELVTELRKTGMRPALIVDHLVGGYCPLVAADGSLSDKQKADRVRHFAQLLTGLAYGPPDPAEEEVLVQTAITPGLLSQVDQAAGRAGVSRDEWIERAIKQLLGQP
jgi:hypothetical protein